jgi:hypothetical protein
MALLTMAVPAGRAEVKTFPSKTIDIRTYATYEWVPIRLKTKMGLFENDPDVSPLVRKALERELAKKGYTVDPKGSNLQLIVAALGGASHQLEAIFAVYSWDHYWWGSNAYGEPHYATMSRVNREGTLAVALVDKTTKKGIWCGYVTNGLGRPEDIEKDVDKAASKLISKLPARK